MFGRKKTNMEPAAEPKVAVQTIPLEFYAENNPSIQFKETKKIIGATGAGPMPFKAGAKFKLFAGGVKFKPAELLTNRKFLILAAAVLFVIFFVGAGVYYYLQLKSKPAPAASRPLPAIIPTTSTVAVPSAEIAAPVAPAATVVETVAPPALTEPALQFPSILLGDAVDSDRDGLTDPEEELYKTDPFKPDSDADGYSDSQEVYNLYDPTKGGESKLADSGLIKEYNNSAFDYRLFYPVNWAVGDVGNDNRDILFSTFTGENIEIRVFDKDASIAFPAWFAAHAGAENLNDLLPFNSVFNFIGYRRKDYLVYYFPVGNRVYTITFHTTDSAAVNYRSVIKMLARSMRLAGSNATVPERAPELGEEKVSPPAVSSTPAL